MNFDDAVQRSTVVRQEHKERLLTCLRTIPDVSWAVGSPSYEFDRLQGDFFPSFPVVYLKPDGAALVNRRTVMLVNNTCDLLPDRLSMITVAPVFDFATYLKALEGARDPEWVKKHAEAIVHNKISELLFVSDLSGFELGAFIRLDQLSSVAYVMLEQAVSAGTRMASLTQSGLYLFLMKITNHFGRSESNEVSRAD